MAKVYFLMPAYNEAENIVATIGRWYPIVEKIASEGNDSRLVIANDGSKDDTFQIMTRIKDKYPLFIPLDKTNEGHGATVLFLYRYALNHDCDYVFQTDSDGQTDPQEFLQMWEHREEYDFQIGNRIDRQDGLGRVFVTKILKFVVWLMFHEWVVDANTPFRLMKTKMLKPIMEVVPKDYFLCNVAISAIAVKWHYKIGWYKISFKPRQGGVNSINMKRIVKIGLKAIKDFFIINRKIKNRV